MTQPSGKVLDLPSEWGFVLRSSPFICAADAIATLSSLLKSSIELGSPRVAARSLLEDRSVEARFDDITDQEQAQSFTQFRQNTIVRLMLFVLSTLLGLIKIFGMQGIPWTKAWASMFWSSFLILELLNLLAGKKRRYPMTLVGDRSRGNVIPAEARFILVAMIIFVPIIAMYGILSQYPVESETSRVTVSQANLIIVFGGVFAFILGPLAVLVVEARTPGFGWLAIGWILVLLNFFEGLGMYVMLFDSKGTVKPWWTEYLG